MAKIHSLSISNFRGIESLHQVFNSGFVCLIGRGDSGKSTIIEAIALALSSSWNISFFDNDFYKCDTTHAIIIEVTLTDIPIDLLEEHKFGLYQRFLNEKTGEIIDEVSDECISTLTVRLEVKKDLEPEWTIISGQESNNKPISAHDRAKFNTFLLSDHADRHFSWSKGSPLYALLKQINSDDDLENPLLDVSRKMKSQIDSHSFDDRFTSILSSIKTTAAKFGIDITNTQSSIDFKDLLIKEGKISLHEESIPFRLKGKGTKRLISMSIQSLIADNGGIVLIDEVEQGLEPDRVQNLISTLKENNHGQVFLTTHSRDVIVELTVENLFLIHKGNKSLLKIGSKFQGLLRSNPEALFARKILLCEGPTEIGICRALNENRVDNGKSNIAYRGVRFANGSGSNLLEYAQGLINLGFKVCLFCDSDDSKINTAKPGLKAARVEIVDWDAGENIETGIFKELAFPILLEVFELAATLKKESNTSKNIDECKADLFTAIKSRMPGIVADKIESVTDLQLLQTAIAISASKNEWFKRTDKAQKLGRIILNHIDDIQDASQLKINLKKMSDWIDAL